MFDRINEMETLLKHADKKLFILIYARIFDLSITNERQTGYIK